MVNVLKRSAQKVGCKNYHPVYKEGHVGDRVAVVLEMHVNKRKGQLSSIVHGTLYVVVTFKLLSLTFFVKLKGPSGEPGTVGSPGEPGPRVSIRRLHYELYYIVLYICSYKYSCLYLSRGTFPERNVYVVA